MRSNLLPLAIPKLLLYNYLAYTLSVRSCDDCSTSFRDIISPILITSQLILLVIDHEISIDESSKFACRLPNLTSLIMSYLSCSTIKFVIDNKTLNMRLEKLTTLE
jgi:hypothetical protein